MDVRKQTDLLSYNLCDVTNWAKSYLDILLYYCDSSQSFSAACQSNHRPTNTAAANYTHLKAFFRKPLCIKKSDL